MNCLQEGESKPALQQRQVHRPARAWIALCLLLAAANSLSAQQPVIVQAAAQSRQQADLPQPEPLPPGAPQRLLGLADLEHMAIRANPAIIRASALVGAARGNLVQVGLPPNPTVGYDGQQLGSGGRAEQHGILFSQEIVRGGKLRLNRAVAEQEMARAQQELAVAQQRVLTDVRIAFYQVLLAQRQIDLTENLVRISRQGANAVDALVKAKEGTRADLLQAQLEVENAQVLARNARNRHDAAWRGLSAVVGQPELPQQALDGDAYAPPKEINFHDALGRLQSTSPEMATAMSEISRARASLERARVEPIPNAACRVLSTS
jgi:cobalt-zinc-cadmium efflux system outer membrane protein